MRDLVKCCNCGWHGTVETGCDVCPNCKKEGCLAWQNENRQEVDCETTSEYWDCECKENYIHPKTEESCAKCGLKREDQPDSRVNEVERFLNTAKKEQTHGN